MNQVYLKELDEYKEELSRLKGFKLLHEGIPAYHRINWLERQIKQLEEWKARDKAIELRLSGVK